MTHDLVVAGGRVLCPATGVDCVADVAIDDGLVHIRGPSANWAAAIDAGRFSLDPERLDRATGPRVGPAERAHHRRGILDVPARDQVLEQREPGIIEREVWRRLRADARRREHAGKDDGGAEGAEGWWHRPVRYAEDDAVAIFCP